MLAYQIITIEPWAENNFVVKIEYLKTNPSGFFPILVKEEIEILNSTEIGQGNLGN